MITIQVSLTILLNEGIIRLWLLGTIFLLHPQKANLEN